jgi:hypothetical protein
MLSSGLLGVTIVLLSLSMFGCGPWMRIETNRKITLDQDRNDMLFMISGFMACPVTVEGPFPEWADSVRLHFSEVDPVLEQKQGVFEVRKDFTVQYDAAQAGQLTIEKGIARLSLQFVERHQTEEPLNGDYQFVQRP